MTKKAIYTILAIILTAGLAVSGYYLYDKNKDKETEIVDYHTCKDNGGVLSGNFDETCTKEDQDYTRELTEEEKLAKIQTFEDCEKEKGAVIEESKCTIYGKEFTKEIVMLTYTNPDYPGFSFEYSSDWEISEENGLQDDNYLTTIKLIKDNIELDFEINTSKSGKVFGSECISKDSFNSYFALNKNSHDIDFYDYNVTYTLVRLENENNYAYYSVIDKDNNHFPVVEEFGAQLDCSGYDFYGSAQSLLKDSDISSFETDSLPLLTIYTNNANLSAGELEKIDDIVSSITGFYNV